MSFFKRKARQEPLKAPRTLDLEPVVLAMAQGWFTRQAAGADLSWDDLEPYQQRNMREHALSFLIPGIPEIEAQLNDKEIT